MNASGLRRRRGLIELRANVLGLSCPEPIDSDERLVLEREVARARSEATSAWYVNTRYIRTRYIRGATRPAPWWRGRW
jgi:hypothetical protein